MKSGGVLAVVPYPPAGFDIYFADIAKAAIAKLGTMEGSYPAVQGQLEQVPGKWIRALSVFQQEAKRSQEQIPRPAASVNSQVAPAAAPVFPSVGRTVIRAASGDGTLTTRVEAVGRRVIGSGSRLLGVADRTFSVWTSFVVLPALMIVLLLIVICMAMRRLSRSSRLAGRCIRFMKTLLAAVVSAALVIGALRSGLTPWRIVRETEIGSVLSGGRTAVPTSPVTDHSGDWMRDPNYRTSLEKTTLARDYRSPLATPLPRE
ncbi:MAG: hypothetical protein ABI233_06360 [Chthoniobacterales bacterium]